MSSLQQLQGSIKPASGPTTLPTWVTGWNAITGSPTTTVSNNINVTAGSNRAIIAVVTIDSAVTTITGVTFNTSENFAFVGRTTGTSQSIETWILKNPSVVFGTVTATASTSATMTLAYAYFTGVDQTTPTANYTGTNGSSTAPSISVTSNSGSFVVGAVLWLTPVTTVTLAAGQTDLTNDGQSHNDTNSNIAPSYKTGAASASFGYTLSFGENWTIAACSLRGI